ncbi:50S ribosomal protein L16 [Desulfurococcaceae archaeon MEX13E-LK6-19]|nr:50S ribosomal protein L16 [Desulfurococcaceae archaeon MEX13E-LK6-19]
MPLRPARCYTHFSGPPYTRKEYIPGVPQPKIVKFEMGNIHGDYDYVAYLVMKEAGQIRHNALEAARVMANKYLSTEVGDNNYFLKIRVYPHHVLRENKMMAFAGADRLQDGMRQAFGKPVGVAARVYPGTIVMEVRIKKEHVQHAKEALRRAASKLPLPARIVFKPLKPGLKPIA